MSETNTTNTDAQAEQSATRSSTTPNPEPEEKPPICYRYPKAHSCGCLVPCAKAVPKAEMHEVYPNLFVGPVEAALNPTLLRANAITHIINASNSSYHQHNNKYKYLCIDINDLPFTDIRIHFSRSNEFIESSLSKGGRCLVHCQAGRSRSVTIAAAYIIYKERCSPDEALRIIKAVRNVASPNIGFVKQLILYHKQLTETDLL
eukprot:c437_g1_i1.p1 GENE.c437_g1_i1~~c437_g1_i1.p1  ORF type:complete len:212 (+),score=34.81 c437_g1_i1:27-638(+)